MESLSDAVKTAKSRPALDLNDEILHQISIDVPRTCPDSPIFQFPQVKQSLLRVLYCWSIRRPATGYVQGINDLATPFFDVFIRELYVLNESDDSTVILTFLALLLMSLKLTMMSCCGWKQMFTGACRTCSTPFKTTTPSIKPAFIGRFRFYVQSP